MHRSVLSLGIALLVLVALVPNAVTVVIVGGILLVEVATWMISRASPRPDDVLPMATAVAGLTAIMVGLLAHLT